MKLLIFLIKWGFPFLLATDLSSELLENEIILDISRGLRILILFLFIIENIRYFNFLKKFNFFRYFFFFNLILFIYLGTDEVFLDGFWMYSKTLFWTLGINVLFIYDQKRIFIEDDFLKVIKKVILIAFTFTAIFLFNGSMESDYNVASYLVLFMYPILLYNTNGYKKNMIYVFLSALAILITLKRGAILAFILGNVIYYLGLISNSFSVRKVLSGLVLLLFLLFTTIYFINNQSSQNSERFSSEQFDLNNSKAGSGRVGMYTSLYEGWLNSDKILFGNGFRADYLRQESNNTFAHSDVFGFLYNFGLLGITLILILYVKLIKFYNKFKKYDRSNANIILSLLIILILINIYSGMFIGSTNPIYFFGLISYLQLKII
jgi:hypothetical protein